jgi:Fe-S-cluster containining protein
MKHLKHFMQHRITLDKISQIALCNIEKHKPEHCKTTSGTRESGGPHRRQAHLPAPLAMEARRDHDW